MDAFPPFAVGLESALAGNHEARENLPELKLRREDRDLIESIMRRLRATPASHEQCSSWISAIAEMNAHLTDPENDVFLKRSHRRLFVVPASEKRAFP